MLTLNYKNSLAADFLCKNSDVPNYNFKINLLEEGRSLESKTKRVIKYVEKT